MAKKTKSSKAPQTPVNSPLPGQDFIDDEKDGELAIIFLTEFRALEQAIIRAGFTKASGTHGALQPDWVAFIRYIERRFHPERSVDVLEAVITLLRDPEKLALRKKRLQASLPGERSSAQSDILWLSELVQETAHKLTHGIPFLKKADYDSEQIMAALMVVEAWSYCDPMIEGLLTHVQ